MGLGGHYGRSSRSWGSSSRRTVTRKVWQNKVVDEVDVKLLMQISGMSRELCEEALKKNDSYAKAKVWLKNNK